MTKFTPAQVAEYRKQYASMIATGAKTALLKRQIASRHEVSNTAVYRMLTGKTWEPDFVKSDIGYVVKNG